MELDPEEDENKTMKGGVAADDVVVRERRALRATVIIQRHVALRSQRMRAAPSGGSRSSQDMRAASTMGVCAGCAQLSKQARRGRQSDVIEEPLALDISGTIAPAAVVMYGPTTRVVAAQQRESNSNSRTLPKCRMTSADVSAAWAEMQSNAWPCESESSDYI